MDAIPLTNSFSHNPEDLVGYVIPTPKDVSAKADLTWELYKKNPQAFSIEPGYIKHDDGTIELIEFSIVPNYKGDKNEVQENKQA